ncbi:MAG: leucine-rich repeat domain-containing protein [Alphaproteobacteria bacterium]|nr:leucine-rich repeat domain-containing protein [Alphaproteobacteria bacterium]
MRKLLLSACVAAVACWMNDAGAMEGKAIVTNIENTGSSWKSLEKEVNASIVECKSRNNRFLMINRWELGNCSGMSDYRYLHINYSDTERKFKIARQEAGLTQEMGNVLCRLPESIEALCNLKILNVCSFTDRDNYVISREKICLRSLPDSIGSLTNLRILDLSSNDLCKLPDSIGNLKNLEELYLSRNYRFSKLPDSIGNLESLKILNLEGTNLGTLPESMGNLVNLENLSFSKATATEGPHTYGCCRAYERIYKIESDSPYWYRDIIDRSLKHWSCPSLVSNNGKRDLENSTLSLNLSGKNLKQIPFGIYMMEARHGIDWCHRPTEGYATPALTELDISNNQITKIPRLLGELRSLGKLYIHNNPNLNHLPDFLWKIYSLKELKIDGKLIRDLPESAKVSLEDKKLENQDIIDLALTGKNNKKMSDEALAKKTGPYTVYLK